MGLSTGFSTEWDTMYQSSAHMSIWPWSDLISFVMRYARPSNPANYNVLEVGCGAGANIAFFKHLGVHYYGIDGSPTIVAALHERYPELHNQIVVGDFTQEIPFDCQFDAVVDRGSVTCNSTEDIQRCLELIYNKLKPGGKFIGIDWYSNTHSDYGKAPLLEDDPYTSTNLTEGHLANTGRVNFSDKAYLQKLFSQFELEVMQHKVIHQELPENDFVFASRNLVAKKPA